MPCEGRPETEETIMKSKDGHVRLVKWETEPTKPEEKPETCYTVDLMVYAPSEITDSDEEEPFYLHFDKKTRDEAVFLFQVLSEAEFYGDMNGYEPHE